MDFPMQFICSGRKYSTLEEYVPAPYFRKSFALDRLPESAEILVCGLGFYELYINGEKITKGMLSPYISNPDDVVYYDRYEVSSLLQKGENVIGLLLGNGFQNNPGGYVWDFDKAKFRGAPQVALSFAASFGKEASLYFETDETFKTAPSPIINDDYRNGEYYDARKELPGWNLPGYDDSDWTAAQMAPVPRGEAVEADIERIRPIREILPFSVTQIDGGYLYDFREDISGVCRLEIQGTVGQKVSLYYGENIVNGKLDRRSISFDDNDYVQKDIYYCKGEGTETYTPTFTYHGFRYVFVKGITDHQAERSLLTCIVCHTDLKERGGFSCSDPVANQLQEMTRRSTLTNFHHFPTDCPQREKNGWTADAALSAEHVLLNLEPEKNYREWLRNIRKAQNEKGALPGIVPTGGWGFQWGNGPAWDSVLIILPYMTYLYRHDKQIILDNSASILRYLYYLTTVVRPDGLIACGLGDWCPVGRGADQYKSPLEFTDTVISMDLCEKAAFLFRETEQQEAAAFAESLYQRLRQAGRKHLLNLYTMTALGNCQTSQAMAIYYDLFDPAEKPKAFEQLLTMVHEQNDHMDVGVLGGRVLFHVLAQFGYSDLAYTMITRKDFPSYGYWVEKGSTTLWEQFLLTEDYSLNHHFWGDISHWFIRWVAGIHYNPDRKGGLNIAPAFISELSKAQGWHQAPEGRIFVTWEKEGDAILLTIEAPEELAGWIKLPENAVFEEEKTNCKPLKSGKYSVILKK